MPGTFVAATDTALGRIDGVTIHDPDELRFTLTLWCPVDIALGLQLEDIGEPTGSHDGVLVVLADGVVAPLSSGSPGPAGHVVSVVGGGTLDTHCFHWLLSLTGPPARRLDVHLQSTTAQVDLSWSVDLDPDRALPGMA